MLKFRDLRADEIDCRVAQVKEGGVSLLLYKDARCDMNILDETLGPENWQRHHTRDNANCIVSIWDDTKKQWIEKEDTGTESNTEKEKGLASDSFKRACFNVGIGRELYTAPFIWVKAADCTISKGNNGKPACYDRFSVSRITIVDKKIVGLAIVNDKTHKVVFEMGNTGRRAADQGKGVANQSQCAANQSQSTAAQDEAAANEQMAASANAAPIDAPKVTALLKLVSEKGCALQSVLDRYKVAKAEDMTFAQWNNAMKILNKMQGRTDTGAK